MVKAPSTAASAPAATPAVRPASPRVPSCQLDPSRPGTLRQAGQWCHEVEGGEVADSRAVRESPTKSSTGKSGGCATGKYFSNAVLVARGQRYELADVVETSCAVADGLVRKNYTGHVTLMK